MWRKILSVALKEEGYEVEFEENAFGAISRIGWEFDKLDFVIIDYDLPQYNGAVIETIIKKTGIKACYFTGYAPSEITEQVSFPIFQKELGIGALLRQIKSLCGHQREALAL